MSLVICLIKGVFMSDSLNKKIKKSRVRRKSYCLDLRIQSPTSLGYMHIEGIDTAPALVRLAKIKGLDVISVTDFFSARFVDELKSAAEGSKVEVLPGVMLRCVIPNCEDVVVACFFKEEATTEYISELLFKHLAIPKSVEGSSSFVFRKDFKEVISLVEEFGGVMIPSRMDKTPYRRDALKSLVEDYGFRAFDLAYFSDSEKYFKETWPEIEFHLFNFSNAKALAQVGSRNSKVMMAKPGFRGLAGLVGRV